MLTFRSLRLSVLLMLSLVAPGAGQAADPGAGSSVELHLQHASARDVSVALRALAGTRELELVSDRVLRVTDTSEALKLAEQVLALVDSPAGSAPGSFEVPHDQTEVVAFRPQQAAPADVMKALRTVLQVSKVYMQQDPELIIVRDTAEKTQAARALMEILERPCP